MRSYLTQNIINSHTIISIQNVENSSIIINDNSEQQKKSISYISLKNNENSLIIKNDSINFSEPEKLNISNKKTTNPLCHD